MQEISDKAIDELRNNNDMFNMLYEEHVFLDEQLKDLNDYKNSVVEIDRIIKNLKKLKLKGKDKMIEIAK
ncbi:MAG TPA: hypothetical protein VK982_09020, partial [Bacteroidales bacterium]|nr:hypothetical protein [Bacteroidales bacterium]